MAVHRYAIGLGSNRPHGRHGPPRRILSAAVDAITDAGLEVQAVAPIVQSAPVGPSLRRYANSAAIVRTDLAPPALLAVLKAIERDFGRRGGRRWGTRVLDLDILLWSGGGWSSRRLVIPHVQIRWRRFVLDPLAAVAPDWRIGPDMVAHARARLTRPRPAHRSHPRSGP